VRVYAAPRVSILSTGDELAEPGQAAARAGAIPDSVSFGVSGLARAWGGQLARRRRTGDRLVELLAAAREAVETSDIVVVTGGASVGERDHARAMFQPLGLELVFSEVAMKPGKPVWVGQVGDVVIVGLPGNPSAAMTTARLFLAPLLAAGAGGEAVEAWRWRTAPLAAPLEACGDREAFPRATEGLDGVRPLSSQDSSSQKGLAATDLLIRRRPGAPTLSAGRLVEVLAV
jgi:molybdopterin molybdotransferase